MQQGFGGAVVAVPPAVVNGVGFGGDVRWCELV